MTSRRALLKAIAAGASLGSPTLKRALCGELVSQAPAESSDRPTVSEQRIFEWTIESGKEYRDPFNDVDVDVIFERNGQSWRVPTFWRGMNQWTVRFAAPEPGEYIYRLDSTDRGNADLNGHVSRVTIAAYQGKNPLLRGGMIRVSASKRYFEQADGTPFFWLGDTWWTDLSDRLPWEGFKRLARDRKSKGFTVVQICAGLVPSNEELAPVDPGFCNEGGCVWDPQFTRINPRYFDYADRRIQYLVGQGLVPAIVGGWHQVLAQMGVEKMKKHWRYVIARYGAYPVIWIAGGEVWDPGHSLSPKVVAELRPEAKAFVDRFFHSPGWTEVVRYIRNIDPYHHPLSVHELPPPFDNAIQDEGLTDFDLFVPDHFGDPSIATEIALLNKHYARTTVTKPLVVGEINYERMGGENSDTCERNAFWLAMLNGAAGFTYGTISTAEAYSPDKPLHRGLLSPYTWEEAMAFPGARELALGSRLLRKYSWWKIAPHPEWVTPRGTTLLEPDDRVSGFDIDLLTAALGNQPRCLGDLPLGEWHEHGGNWRLPYAAGIPRQLRLIYFPYTYSSRLVYRPGLTIIHGLEPDVRYQAYYWDPVMGVKVDLAVLDRGEVDISSVNRRLYDASGNYWGQLNGPVWGEYGTHQRIIGDEYEPERLPWAGDWLLILVAQDAEGGVPG